MLLCALCVKTPSKTVSLAHFEHLIFGILVIPRYDVVILGKSVSVCPLCLCQSLECICCDGSIASFTSSSLSIISNPGSRQGRRCLNCFVQLSPETESYQHCH